MAHYLDDGRGEVLNICRSYFRAAQALQASLFRSWMTPPVESLDAPVPEAVTVVEADVLNLLNQLRELQMLAAPRVISAAANLYEAIRAAADAQFELHLRSPGNVGRLCDLDSEAFAHHSGRVDSALEEFSRAVGRQTVSTGGPDRDKMARVARTIPPDVPWMTFLLSRQPLRRIPDWVAAGVDDAHEALQRDIVDFTDPGLARLHQELVDALGHLADEFSGTFPPEDSDTLSYTEVPPEWKRTDPTRYYETLQALSDAREEVLGAYKKLMNAMSSQSPAPDPQSPAGQSVNITAGDNSPVNVSAPYAQASNKSTARATIGRPSDDAGAKPWWNRGAVLWTALGSVAAVVGAIAAVIALYK